MMCDGKWKNIKNQKHNGYTSWNDNFEDNILHKTFRIDETDNLYGGYCFVPKNNVVSIEAEHFYMADSASAAKWTVIPYLGRTLSGIALMPYSTDIENASLSYRMTIPNDINEVDVYVIVKSTLDFHNKKGHEYSVGFEGAENKVVNFNHNLNEDPENIYTVFYPTVARRIVEKKVRLRLPKQNSEDYILNLKPLDSGIVFQKIVVDLGGYKDSYLYMDESPNRRISQ